MNTTNTNEWTAFIKTYFETLPFFRFLDTKVESTAAGKATLTLPVKAEYANTYGIAHGGLVAALCDMASGICLRTLQIRCLTVNLNIDYIKPARMGHTLIAEGEMVTQGKTLLRSKVTVKNEEGVIIALAHAVYYNIGEDDLSNYDVEGNRSKENIQF